MPTLKVLLFGMLSLAMAIALVLRVWLEGVGDTNVGLFSGLLGLAGAAGWFGAFALRRNGLGWGDVRLAGVVGATLGIPLALAAVTFICLAGAF